MIMTMMMMTIMTMMTMMMINKKILKANTLHDRLSIDDKGSMAIRMTVLFIFATKPFRIVGYCNGADVLMFRCGQRHLRFAVHGLQCSLDIK